MALHIEGMRRPRDHEPHARLISPFADTVSTAGILSRDIHVLIF